MIETKIDVVNKLGLHARASSKLAQLAGSYASDIRLGKEDEALVDAKSIMGLMLLAAGIGSSLFCAWKARTKMTRWLPFQNSLPINLMKANNRINFSY